MKQQTIRNIAIIAHVDHGKTTLVDQLFKQSGIFRENQHMDERLMDSMDQEKERGITITSKNGGIPYKEYWINIIDTPGHADFGGQVERVLHMADGVLLLVDAAEGPKPQTYFVLKKALERQLRVIVVINKIDKPDARPDWVIDKVFDLFVELNAPDEFLDFPIVYASARNGFARLEPNDSDTDFRVLFDAIVKHVPAPKGDASGPVQLLISSLSYSSFLGRLAIGKVTSGSLKVNQNVVLADGETMTPFRVTKLYQFHANVQKEVQEAGLGDIVSVAGIETFQVGQTITDPQNPMPLPKIAVDPPTLSVNFIPNDSPFAGKEGEFVTSRHIQDRLDREVLSDVALHVEELGNRPGFKVSGRGELHLSVLIEKMRREGFEFQVSRPQVVLKEENGVQLEPYEKLVVEVDEAYSGRVMELMGNRKGVMTDMEQRGGRNILTFKVPTRGLIGFRSQCLTETKGTAVMNNIFDSYGPKVGGMRNRKNGVLISKEQDVTIAYSLFNIQERGRLFLGPGVNVYEGQIIGENAREDDMVVNASKGKKLTNMRASGSDDTVVLTPPVKMSLEDCLAFINDDELVEVTPQSIRLRKVYLKETDRKRNTV